MYQKIHRWVDEEQPVPEEPDGPRDITRNPDDCNLEELPEPKRRELPADDY
ncbi:MAG: hypothetical protein ACM336_06395 [Acidobacteriota bacterium]